MAQAAPLLADDPETLRPLDDAAPESQKKSFLRMVSHELRTPLNSILGFSEILTSELYGPLGSPHYKEYAAIIHGSGQKLLHLVNQLLEIARLDGRTIDFERRGESLDATLDEVLTALAADLAARRVEVIIADRGALPRVLADSRGLRTIFLNLMHNAVAFSPEGGRVDVWVEIGPGATEVHIADEGEGVDPSQIERLMTPFEQGENALTRRSEGAGLGLPIADLTARAMGGAVTLKSAPGAGLTATVRLLRA